MRGRALIRDRSPDCAAIPPCIPRPLGRARGLLALALVALAATASAEQPPAGDAARGASLVASRSQGLCVLCHAVPGTPTPLQGTLAPDLSGVATRLTPSQLRERLVAPERFNPDTLMPGYLRSEGFTRVAASRQGQALFTEAQLDDVVAYLATLR